MSHPSVVQEMNDPVTQFLQTQRTVTATESRKKRSRFKVRSERSVNAIAE
jgi:hypothetical protein